MDEKTLKRLHLRRISLLYKSVRRKFFYKGDLFQKKIGRELIDYYNGDKGHQVDPKTGNLGYGLIHYSLIRNLKPERVLCIGSRKGFIPAICVLACKDNQKGKVDFIDAGFDETSNKSWSGVGFWKKIDVKKHFLYQNVSDFINFYLMTTSEFVKKNNSREYEYIYIDGDHSYDGVKLDYELFWPRLKKGGLMVFHDATVKNWGALKNFGVWKLMDEINNGKKIILPLDQSGLAIIQK